MTDSTEALNEFKKDARSLLIPHPDGLTNFSFFDLYRNHFGKDIPYRLIGYYDRITLMKSIPDAVEVREFDDGKRILFLPVVTEETEHIRKAVMTQNIPKNRKPTLANRLMQRIRDEGAEENPQEFYREGSNVNKPKPQIVPDYIKRNIIRLIERSTEGLEVNTFENVFKDHFKEDIDFIGLGYQTMLDLLDSIEELKIVNTQCMFVVQLKNKGPLRPPFPSDNSKEMVVQKESNPKSMSLSQCEQKKDYFSEEPVKVSKEMRNNFRDILKACPEGLAPWNLAKEYERKTGKPLHYGKMGFENAIELAEREPTIFKIGKKNNKYRLYGATGSSCTVLNFPVMQKLEEDVVKLLKVSRVEVPIENLTSEFEATFGAQIAGGELSAGDIELGLNDIRVKLLKRGVQFNELEIGTILWYDESKAQEPPTPQTDMELDQQRFPKNKDSVEVVVMEVNDPHDFFFCLNDNLLHLNNIMEELNCFYGTGNGGWPINEADCAEGSLCAAPYLDVGYHRAKIISTNEQKRAKVQYVDFGTVGDIDLNELRVLHPKFYTFPAQAIKGVLYGADPVDSARGFSDDMIDLFSRIVAGNKVFSATFMGRDNQSGAIIVELHDQNAGEQNISQLLISSDKAARSQQTSSVAQDFKPTELPQQASNIGQQLQLSDPYVQEILKELGVSSTAELHELVKDPDFVYHYLQTFPVLSMDVLMREIFEQARDLCRQ